MDPPEPPELLNYMEDRPSKRAVPLTTWQQPRRGEPCHGMVVATLSVPKVAGLIADRGLRTDPATHTFTSMHTIHACTFS
jgi:hypothetical protein